jgi:hypothetical protein
VSSIDPQFAADFTDRYAPYLNPLPEVNSFREFARFVPNAQRAGRQFRGPIQSAISHGITIDITGTAYALNAARPAGEQEYILDAPDILLRETFPYSAMLKASNGVSKDGQAAAYWAPLDKVMMTMLRGIDHYTEIAMLFGCGSGATILSDIGVVATTAVGAGTGPNYGSATHPLVQLTAQSWAAGLWNNAGNGGNSSGGMLVDIMNAAGTATVETGVAIEGVGDPALCQVQMFKTGSAVAVTTGTRIVPAGWFQKSCAGVQGWLQNTGTLANISAATNVFWRPRQFSAGNAAMTRSKVLQICAKLFPNGATKGLVAFANAHTFADLAEETSVPTSAGGQWFENGAETRVQGATKLEYLSPVGKVEVRLHEYQKQGVMFFLEPGNTVRIGAADTTVRGAQGGEGFFLELPNNAGSEVRCTSQQAPFIRYPYRCAIATNITSTGQDTSGS